MNIINRAEDEHCMRSLSYMTAIHLDRLQKEDDTVTNNGKAMKEDGVYPK